LDIYVVYSTCYGGVQNFVDEDGHWWSYQWQGKAKLWPSLQCVVSSSLITYVD
jgi:hypothetical protein